MSMTRTDEFINIVEIDYNPYEGLKLLSSLLMSLISSVEIDYNPYEGLKQLYKQSHEKTN